MKKVKVIKRDTSNDKRITREKSLRERLMDRRSDLLHEVSKINKQLEQST